MKRSYIRYIGSGIGMFLILGGLIWTCQKLASPERLSASDTKRPIELTASREPAISFSPATMRLTAAGTARPVSADRVTPESAPDVPAPKPLPLSSESVNKPAQPAAAPSETLLSDPEPIAAEPIQLTPSSSVPTAPATESSRLSLSDVTEPESFNALAENPAAEPGLADQHALPGVESVPATPMPATPMPATAASTTPMPTTPMPMTEMARSAADPTLPVIDFPVAPTDKPANELAASTHKPEEVASRIEPYRTVPQVALSALGRPGAATLEGTQKAELSLTKELPGEIQVGREEVFKVLVKNIGTIAAKNVVLRDMIPAGTRLASTTPQIEPTSDGELVWNNFDLAPNEERVFEYCLIPETEGEIGSVANVSFNVEASGKTFCTRPLLKLAVQAPNSVLIGENVRLDIEISNPGTGIARNVSLREEVPDGLRHAGGKALDNSVGEIAPGETKKLSLTVQAAAAGTVANRLYVTADGGLSEEVINTITVNAPELALEIAGAKVRYLEREAVYTLKVWNPGTAAARDVKLIAELPPQMKFVRTNNEGVYQESTHSVHWELVELPNNIAPGDIELVLMPTETGSGKLTFRGEGAMNLAADTTHEIETDGISALSFTVASLSDPVEVGRDAVYEIRLTNRGTKESTNVNIAVTLPESMEAVASDGPTRFAPGQNSVVFAPLARIGAKEEVVYRLTTRSSSPGDHRIQVQVGSDDREPLVKEESIRVYGTN